MKKIFFLAALLFPLVSFAGNNDTHEYKLKNGLKIIVKENHRAPVAAVYVFYKVGSSYEPLGITGISHVLEHMMFQGTTNFPGKQLEKIISMNGGSENAQTSNDYTLYYQQIAKDRLPISFKLEADRMENLNLSDAVFAKEIQVVKEERRLRTDNNPQFFTYERFLAGAFISNPYHQPVVGWMNDLNNMSTSDLRNWYKQWYAPNNAVLVVVGDVKPANVYRLAENYFGKIARKKLPAVKPFSSVMPVGQRSLEVKVPAKLPWLIIGYNVPSLNSVDKNDRGEAYALAVASALLNQGNSSRLSKNIIRGRQIASEASAEYDLYARLPTLFSIYGVPSQQHTAAELQQAFMQEIKRLQTGQVNNEELARAKIGLIAAEIYTNDSILNQGMEIGAVESVGLSWHDLDNFEAAINSVTAEQVQKVVVKYLTGKNMTVAELVPQPLQGNVADSPAEIGDTNVR